MPTYIITRSHRDAQLQLFLCLPLERRIRSNSVVSLLSRLERYSFFAFSPDRYPAECTNGGRANAFGSQPIATYLMQ